MSPSGAYLHAAPYLPLVSLVRSSAPHLCTRPHLRPRIIKAPVDYTLLPHTPLIIHCYKPNDARLTHLTSPSL
ncbi:hypothetical protein E2C01_016727 [Portunus trituberculatus]|uniref:Uncharacterized protein n=1 Tax=Portunus trituberculatus TaxID=210409 RepID=A0A5B7DQL4_PORTR|nr:hypothetical protein [Portunus trituberculatus]